jgi:hypothetical protein
MSTVDSITAAASPTAQALAATQSVVTGASGSQAQKLGLPPVGLAQAASTNTINAQLVSSQWGVDPSTVSGVFGGAAVSDGLFAGDTLLPLLTNISHANAEQALALIGITTPKPGSSGTTTGTATSADASQAYAAANPTAVAEAAAGSGPLTVDPLWGRQA